MLHFSFPVGFVKIRNQALSTESITHLLIQTSRSPGPMRARAPAGLQDAEEPLVTLKNPEGRGKTQVEELKVVTNHKWKTETTSRWSRV